ncbi:hypothetical protein N7530_002703 [Penicillium desertorum]|uniref:Uncharacterized protein n=1 Tax=Penicillium desertorum TaxID=1303715 RepID=A0A9X0BTC2_9EURO|nr:hypothetical protein N7530_002703 [Penicillium desertorum]
MKDAVISSYLEDLGPLKSAIGNSALVTASQIALEGCLGPSDLKDQVIATISWQATQMQRVGRLLEHLAQQRLVTDLVDVEIAKQALADHGEHIMEPLVERFREGDKLRCLENPPRLKAMSGCTSMKQAAGWLTSWPITG